jgi:hypothetical protein
VLLLSAEDGLADTVKPRLELLGADMSRIDALGLTVSKGEEEVGLSLQEHLSQIEKAIAEKQVVLLIIDPLLAFTGKVDTHKTAEVRGLLSPLATMAERTGCAILGVMHPNKNSHEANLLYRISASLDFAAAARSVMVVAKHPNNPDQRVMATVKCNLSAHPEPLAFGFTHDGHFTWQGVTEVDVSRLMAPVDREDSSALDEAKQFLRDVLAGSDMPAKDVLAEARECSIHEKTLRRAVKDLGIDVARVGEEGRRGGGKWVWRLPLDARDLDGQTPRPTDDHLNAPASDDTQGLRWPSQRDDHLNPSVSDDHLNQPSPDSDSDTKPDKDIKMANPETRDLTILINDDGDDEIPTQYPPYHSHWLYEEEL